MRPQIRLITALLIVVTGLGIFSSCANFAFRIIYNRLDTMVVDRIDDMFELTADQEAYLSKEAAAMLKWHRTTELPKYISLMQRIKNKSKSEITTEDIRNWRREIRQNFIRAGMKISPVSAEFLTTVDEEQIPNLKEWFKEFNQKYYKSIAAEQHERDKERLDKSLNILEDFFGEFSTAQKQKLGNMQKAMPDMLAPFHKVRLKRQSQIVGLLEKEADKDEYLNFMHRIFAGSRAVTSGKQRAIFDEWYDKMPQFVVDFWNMLTSKQQNYFRAQLDIWIGRLAYAKNN